MAATQTEELAGSRLATSAQPPRTTSPFFLHVSSEHAPQPMRLVVPLETPGALLEGLRCLTVSRPLPTRKEFQGKTMSRFLLITNLRPSEDDRQNVFWGSLRLDRNLNRGLCWNLDRTWRIVFSVLWQTRYRLRLRGCISPHDRSRTNAEHGAK